MSSTILQNHRSSCYSLFLYLVIAILLSTIVYAASSSSSGSGNRLETETSSTSGQRSMNWMRLVYGTSSYGTGVSSLLMSKDDIDQNKIATERKMNSIFGFTGGNIPGSVESYVYLMCKAHIPTTGNGLAVLDTTNGAVMLAYAAGKRITYEQYNYTDLDEFVSTTSYIYKLSFKVINKDGVNSTLGFNVYLDDVALYNNTIKLDDSESFDKTTSNMIIKKSTNKYSKICIKFLTRDLYVRLDDKRQYLSKLCNTITDGGSTTGTDYTPQGYGLDLDDSDDGETSDSSSSSSSSGGSDNGQNQATNSI